VDRRRGCAWVAAFLALALPLPDTHAQIGGAQYGDYALVALDRTGDGPSADDALFVHFGAGTEGSASAGNVLGTHGLRLTASACCARGTVVGEDDPDRGRPFLRLGEASVAYVERDGRFGASFGDSLYLDLDGTADVSVGDLRFSDGVRVLPGDPEERRPLAPVEDGSFRLKHLDVDGDFYFYPPDLLLLDVSRAAYAAASDVLLTASTSAPVGERLGASSTFAEPTTRTRGGAPRAAPAKSGRRAALVTMRISATAGASISSWRARMVRPSGPTTSRLLSRPRKRRACPPVRMAAEITQGTITNP
jgi:hypothetical protein